MATGAAVTLAGTATGPWGDNVTWQWTQVDGASSNTPVTTGVTLTGATSASASFTAPDAATTLHFRLIATPVPGESRIRGRVASEPDWVTVTVEEAANNAPVFDPDTATRTIAENTAAGTAIGAVIPAATDADNDTLTYSMEGTDAASFTFTAATRQLSTKAALDHEAKASYTVTIKAERRHRQRHHGGDDQRHRCR